MDLLRERLDHLTTQLTEIITKLPDESLPDAWKVLQPIYYDLYMLGAMQESIQTLRPGDVLTREEALSLLQFP